MKDLNLYTLSDQQRLSLADQYQYKVDAEAISAADELSIRSNVTYLYIFHAHKVPPHLGIVVHGLFYSLKANGVDSALATEKINALIHRKKIPTLILEISKDSEKQIEVVFEKYGKSIGEGRTCLHPISEYLFGHSNHSKVGELLSDLERSNDIQQVYGIYLPIDFRGIVNYSIEDINARIKKLQQ